MSKSAQLQSGILRKQVWKSRIKYRYGYIAWESHAAGYELCHQVSTATEL